VQETGISDGAVMVERGRVEEEWSKKKQERTRDERRTGDSKRQDVEQIDPQVLEVTQVAVDVVQDRHANKLCTRHIVGIVQEGTNERERGLLWDMCNDVIERKAEGETQNETGTETTHERESTTPCT
jgi:hypothetical protein